ncbi:MAG: TetR/AcrR family transcriptional regulator [Mycobacteriales bacterium]
MDRVKRSRREESARATRRAVLLGATELFTTRGWHATTIDEVAARAGVSRPTVFAVGTKAELFKQARDLAMAGDDADLEMFQRASTQRVLAEQDPQRCLAAMAEHFTGVQERYGPLDAVLRQAAGADDELAKLLRTSEQQRRTGAAVFVGSLASKAPLAGPRDRMVDVAWLLMAPETHTRLVRDRGWSRRAYVSWLATTLGALVLAPPSG